MYPEGLNIKGINKLLNVSMVQKYDVVVIGAGPAGSTTARAAAEHGLKVLIIDKDSFAGENTACAGGLASYIPMNYKLKDGVIHRYINEVKIVAKGKLIKNASSSFKLPNPGAVTRRVLFDRYLAEIAVEKGAEYMNKTLAKEVKGNQVFTTKGVFEGKVIVGADGTSSIVAKAMGHPPWKPDELALAVAYEIEMPNEEIGKRWGDAIELYFDRELLPHGYAWVFPGDNMLNVGLGCMSTHLKGRSLKKLLDLFMERENISGKTLTFKGGALPMAGPRPYTAKGNMLIVGDAAGHTGQALGEGIRYAIKMGEIAGKCCADYIQGGVPLETYDLEWRKENYWLYRLENAAQKFLFFAERAHLIPISIKLLNLIPSQFRTTNWADL